MRPPALSCQPSKTSTLGSIRKSGFWAPTCAVVKNGPSRKMPATRAPTKSSPRRSSASAMAAQARPMSSTDSVNVVGIHAVVPALAR